jgi:hypothetical protein
MLGTPPPPPPDVVPAIESDVSGATTIRDRLEKHRADAACNVCHRKIDPMGFALEHFDPIGRYRDKYAKPKGDKSAPKVDPTGTFPSGETYADFTEFKRLLSGTRKEFFVRHMVDTMLSFSTGRHMEPTDRSKIEAIAQKVQEEGFGLRTMIVEVLSSEIFRSR